MSSGDTHELILGKDSSASITTFLPKEIHQQVETPIHDDHARNINLTRDSLLNSTKIPL